MFVKMALLPDIVALHWEAKDDLVKQRIYALRSCVCDTCALHVKRQGARFVVDHIDAVILVFVRFHERVPIISNNRLDVLTQKLQ